MILYAIYIASGLAIAYFLKLLLTWLAGKFPIRGQKCQCEFHRKNRNKQ